MKPANAFTVEVHEAADLAAAVLGLPEPQSDEDTEAVEQRFYDVMVDCFYASHWLPANALPLPTPEPQP